MEVSLSLNTLVRIPTSKSCSYSRTEANGGLIRHSLICTKTGEAQNQKHKDRKRILVVVKAKGKRSGGQNKRTPLPPMPKIEEDGNSRFVIFIRMANVYLWYPLSVVAGGTTAKIIVAAKDTFVGKYIYKDTLARNLGAVIYKDEIEIQKTAIKQHRVLRSATDFRYGYKIVVLFSTPTKTSLQNLPDISLEMMSNPLCLVVMRAVISTNDVVELPRQEELKTVLDKVKDFFGDAKESFGKVTSFETPPSTEAEDKFK